ncbi:Txe/YoeB family toxin of toxin-antitoxin system [Lactobacillus colini]|uniref:Endoribonuclease YoeB n=1 Tax=Lactobacillus colini TaxID=1819254 RepID=A0ABS4MCL0_9LACO|nr:Txe/YoeB family addiction module toxin [Lactobacillus colini]MBP2057425.1 Txe/YoeB family toxin of toxin-antitoxin system [Lactobacillus colini]
MSKWRVRAYKDVIKKDIPLLLQQNLKDDFDEIVESLKENPYRDFRNFEKLNPHHKNIYSLRINGKHRLVYTIDKDKREVKVWTAWSHYENRMPR